MVSMYEAGLMPRLPFQGFATETREFLKGTEESVAPTRVGLPF